MPNNINSLQIAAIVVTYNRKELLIECLRALLDQTRKLDKIIIIDNGSTDGTYDKLSELQLVNNPILNYIRLSTNTGGAGGFYEGVKIGYKDGFDWLWLMDDDAEPKEDALEALLTSLQKSSENIVGLTSLKIDVNGDIEKIHRGWFQSHQFKPRQLSDGEYERDECLIGYSSFVGFLIKRDAITKAGFPNKDFFIWFDDIEYSLRLLRHGKLKLVTKSIIVHKDKIDKSKKVYNPLKECWKLYYSVRNRTFILRHYFNRSTLILFAMVLLRALFKILLLKDNKIVRVKLIYYGWRDGINGHLGKTINPGASQKTV